MSLLHLLLLEFSATAARPSVEKAMFGGAERPQGTCRAIGHRHVVDETGCDLFAVNVNICSGSCWSLSFVDPRQSNAAGADGTASEPVVAVFAQCCRMVEAQMISVVEAEKRENPSNVKGMFGLSRTEVLLQAVGNGGLPAREQIRPGPGGVGGRDFGSTVANERSAWGAGLPGGKGLQAGFAGYGPPRGILPRDWKPRMWVGAGGSHRGRLSSPLRTWAHRWTSSLVSTMEEMAFRRSVHPKAPPRALSFHDLGEHAEWQLGI
uniref:LCCL domain-containing protein n=1 Tax=Globodera pallida TaxID=36090 RepID=A0A183C5D7_GLOPA